MAPATVRNANFEDLERDLEALLRDQNPGRGATSTAAAAAAAAFDLDRDELNIYRSGSAPPTVEGSRTAFGSLFGHPGFAETQDFSGPDVSDVLSEEEMRSHPAYLSYYYSNEHVNPRLPPPRVSKEDWRAAQRFHALGGTGDRKKMMEMGSADGSSSSSLFSLQPGLPLRDGEREMTETDRGAFKNLSRRQQQQQQLRQPADWLEKGSDGLVGLPDVGLGSRRRSFADALQEELGHFSLSSQLSRPASRSAFESPNPIRVSDLPMGQLHSGSDALNVLQSGASSSSLARVKSLGSSISHSYASALGSSLSRSTTPDPLLIRRSPSPCLPPVGVRITDSEKKAPVVPNEGGGASSIISNSADITAAISAISNLGLAENRIEDRESQAQSQLHHEFSDQPDMIFNVPSDRQKTVTYNEFSKNNGNLTNLPKLTSNGKVNFAAQSAYVNVYKEGASMGSVNSAGSNSSQGQNADNINIGFSRRNSKAYSGDYGSPLLSNQLNAGGLEGQYLNLSGNQMGSGFQVPMVDPLYAQYLQTTPDSILNSTAASMDPSLGRNYIGSSHMDLPDYQKAYLGALLAQQKLQYGMPFLNKSVGLNHAFYGSNHALGVGMAYPTNQASSSFLPSLGSGSPVRQASERLMRVSSMTRGAGGSIGSRSPENGFMEEGYASSLLEEFKNNKTRSFELQDIVDHVVEFSADQYGSRFIQQKLETATVDEKNKIFPEILPKARALMTDVFGNYVIQKFFEHGTETQRKQLASELTGHVMQLSLQMYGCRVIQKALEVVDIDQKTQMVLELDGSIMKCVRDQNGNHVIQKCIECVPQERIQFIISAFYGHVVALSTHPYGCRVIQRVLEHCDNPKTQSIMMDEIMQSVCTLAQDQYGNYVIQHVLQQGKPEERSAIISKLAGQIVKMSQQKFASNVVEKCLTYGTPEERQLLINEMLGSTDENEPLQVMMKDQFGNYVVQKVLETCDDHNRELILSRIKVHLNALKRYTYGKHIVARVEKLITAGERRIALGSHSS
ncbi:pumilio homolog 1-like [Ananas comosus]|uniref:Pumilio homolog 1-like n=1 Tax=Ananas comosus TaxID=4615 RepID=A0A6P5H746_ANACO|nr:pumilio homolog 1-like [Ananas comosus]XP_020115202.1 pumilio homolog 1-like [Ananas comosus]